MPMMDGREVCEESSLPLHFVIPRARKRFAFNFSFLLVSTEKKMDGLCRGFVCVDRTRRPSSRSFGQNKQESSALRDPFRSPHSAFFRKKTWESLHFHTTNFAFAPPPLHESMGALKAFSMVHLCTQLIDFVVKV